MLIVPLFFFTYTCHLTLHISSKVLAEPHRSNGQH